MIAKTGRVYGEVFTEVRRVAKAKRTFTRLDAGVGRKQFNCAVHKLMARGEIIRVAKGRNGRGFRLAIYSAAKVGAEDEPA